MPSSFLTELLVPLIKTWLICYWYKYRFLQCLLRSDVTDLFTLSPFFLYCLWRCNVTDFSILSPFFLYCLWRCDVTKLIILSPLLLYCLWEVLRHWFVYFVPLIVVLSVAVWRQWFVYIVPFFLLSVAVWRQWFVHCVLLLLNCLWRCDVNDSFIMSPFSCSVCGGVTSLICSFCPPFFVLSVAEWRHWFVHFVPLFLAVSLALSRRWSSVQVIGNLEGSFGGETSPRQAPPRAV